jgi:formamidopyrimidine-DNA glycosylase
VPELPSVTLYLERLDAMVGGKVLEQVRVASPFVLRSVEPPMSAVHGNRVTGGRRMGKRIVIELEDDLFIVMHLMIAGRLKWRKKGAKIPRRLGLAAFDFEHATILYTEASTKTRASLFCVRGEENLEQFERGGLEVLDSSIAEFSAALRRENHTLKRGLTDPRILSGIGNAYSDEILHRAKMSPFKQTSKLSDDELAQLYAATIDVLNEWVQRMREAVGDEFPEKVTAFESAMAVHGKYREPCPVCDSPVQRIVYAQNEANYCATCQTGGKLLADRALSRLLKSNWPRTLEELEDKLPTKTAKK